MGHGLVERQPKNARSRRSVALSPEAIEALKSVRGVRIGQRFQAGPLWQYFGYVFSEADGSPVIPDKITQACSLESQLRAFFQFKSN